MSESKAGHDFGDGVLHQRCRNQGCTAVRSRATADSNVWLYSPTGAVGTFRRKRLKCNHRRKQ